MEMSCQSILTNLVPYWYEAEKEAAIAETFGISKENYNKMIEADGEISDKIIAVREYRVMSQIHEETAYENSLKEKIENTSPDFGIPEYITKLINAGLIFRDGKRVIGNLANVANYLERKCQIAVTTKFLRETFLKTDGNTYSIPACKDAMATIHTK